LCIIISIISIGQGKCGVAVVRVSGPQTRQVLKQVAGLQDLVPERKALLKRLQHPTTGDAIDRGLVLWFPSEYNSFKFNHDPKKKNN
jgi:tRNA modification GTPase